MQFFLNYDYLKHFLHAPYIIPAQFSKFYQVQKATPNNIENYALTNRDGGNHIFASSCRVGIPGPQGTTIYRDIPECKSAQERAYNELVNSTSSLYSLAETAIKGLGDRNVDFLNARPTLKHAVKRYFVENNFSQHSHNAINYLLNQYQDGNNFDANSDLYISASSPLLQDVSNPDRALEFTFNQQAISEGITNFGIVLAELLKDNVNPEFEGFIIRNMFLKNGIIISSAFSNELLGKYFSFKINDGSKISIYYNSGLGYYFFHKGILTNSFLQDPNIIVNTLEQEVNNNNYKLLEIDCNQINNWIELAQQTAPQQIKDKIENYNNNYNSILGDWDIQYLNDAGGTIVNLDYFAVNITNLPQNPNTGQQFTSHQFIDYFRRNINDFVVGKVFEPYCEVSAVCQTETNLWNSNNPLGAIVKLDIPIDDGVVVLADYTNNYWRFMTLEAPFDNRHPVSGTRQFGIEQLANGSYNIYVRGVDRFTSNFKENVAYGVSFGNPFFGADDMWKGFQQKTTEFVNANGGTANSLTPIHNRPDWNEIKDVLEGKKPISVLGCD